MTHGPAAVATSRSALYVCYNRTLADHMIALAPRRATVSSFHELCVDHYRSRQEEPDFANPAMFSRMTDAYIVDSASFAPRFDLLVVDEAQDFDPGWMGSLLPQLKADGRLYVMEDEDQRLYEREPFDLSDAVTITCRDNYRSPQAVCQVINAFALAGVSVVARNPYRGDLPGFHVYSSARGVMNKTAEIVEGLLARGFGIADIVVLTGHGRAKSVLLNAERIGPYRTRRFTGAFSRNSDPLWTEGELLLESVFRFKGQCAPAIVLSEVDFAEMSPLERRKLFVGLTRAQMAVEIVLSVSAEGTATKEVPGLAPRPVRPEPVSPMVLSLSKEGRFRAPFILRQAQDERESNFVGVPKQNLRDCFQADASANRVFRRRCRIRSGSLRFRWSALGASCEPLTPYRVSLSRQ